MVLTDAGPRQIDATDSIVERALSSLDTVDIIAFGQAKLLSIFLYQIAAKLLRKLAEVSVARNFQRLFQVDSAVGGDVRYSIPMAVIL